MQPRLTSERRQHPRRDACLVLTYRPMVLTARYDIIRAGNISQGGMRLTTAKPFTVGARLAIYLRLTTQRSLRLIRGTAEALESREIAPSLLYETHVRFVELHGQSRQILGDFCGENRDQLAATG